MPDTAARDAAFWNDVEDLFSTAVELDDRQRNALFAVRCAGRDDLRAEVESLLAVHPHAQRFMRHPTLAPDPPGLPRLGAGDVVGQFRLVEPIAAGGMGVVFLAERADAAFEQRVAVKIISAPIDREDVTRRFVAERQILASLHHPHIVGLLDAGLTAQGQAYLIMEFVDGVPITTYCREQGLGVRARIRLFQQVCDAVHHAHAHFVVHSDLKPANVLVTKDGVAKILDFGIATLLRGPLANAASPNHAAPEPLTPNYASPEQLRGEPVTVASDVFGLGLLMFELLTGTRPYDVAGQQVDDAVRVITDTTVQPSTAEPAGGVRPPYDLRRQLRGDLDAIVARAVERAPERRYASAHALAQDLARYLDGAPVEARRQTLWYVGGKLAARHRVAFASAAVSAVLILAALATAVWQARVATLQRRRADKRFADVRQLANAVVFNIHDAVAPLPGSTPVRQQIVTEGLKYLERLAGDSSSDAALQLELGRAYLKIGSVQGRPNAANLGDREGAIASFRKAKALLGAVRARGESPLDVVRDQVDAMRFLSETLGAVGASRQEEALAEARAALDVAENYARTHERVDAVRSMVGAAAFAVALRIQHFESIPYWRKAADEYDALLAAAPGDPVRQRNAALVDKYLGGVFERSDLGQALSHYDRALRLDEARFARTPGDRLVQFDLAIDLGNKGYVHWQRREWNEAIALYTRSLELRERLAATDPKDSLSREKAAFLHRQLARVYRDKGDAAAALVHHRQAIAVYGMVASVSAHGRTVLASSWAETGALERAAGRPAPACDAFRRAAAMYQAMSIGERTVEASDENDPLPAVTDALAGCR